VMKYIIGLGAFGFTYWLLDGILDLFIAAGNYTTGDTFNILHMIWTGALLIYIIFGGWWLIGQYDEKQYMRGGFE